MSLDAIIHRRHPSRFRLLRKAPLTTIAKTLNALRSTLESSPATDRHGVVVVCISDTHNTQPALPQGDLLIHAGDLTQHGTVEELQSQLDWINSQPHSHKIVIAGNHDIFLAEMQISEYRERFPLRWGDITYLKDSATSMKFHDGRSLKIHGNPWTRKHGNWAFQYDRGTDMFGGQVGNDVDILVTHSAPRFHLDVAGWGDEFLLQELWRVKPQLHVFGHLHEGYGREVLVYDQFEQLYEMVRAGRAGFGALFKMVLLLLMMWVTGSTRNARRTTLINAAAVGGLRDEKTHNPQIVVL